MAPDSSFFNKPLTGRKRLFNSNQTALPQSAPQKTSKVVDFFADALDLGE
jgi:hypothetical protein